MNMVNPMARTGLLGLLFIEVRQLTPYPRWEARSDDRVEPTMYQYSYSGQWRSTAHRYATLETALLPPEEKPRGGLVPNRYWPNEWVPGVLLQDLESGIYFNRSVRDLARYFPDVPDAETYLYPAPSSESFAYLYAEDGDAFLGAAFRFADLIRAIASSAAGQSLADTPASQTQLAMDALEVLATGASLTLWSRPHGDITARWRTPSLLAAFARMALLDLAEGWIQVCDRCDRIYVSSAGRARFCSPRCRHAVQRRQWRARKKSEPKNTRSRS
ncbi:MAG TPA: hypothetical protein VN442_00665 [Bryobacteraceae bacterium]|nr:hypothetical protein [Bryobacteraceae bacterium]